MTDMTKQAQIFDKILKKEENKLCADCRRKSPSWASLNLGVLVCMKCSGIHRGLGVHISKVKSVNLDKWPEDALQNFQKINNKIANQYWESKLKDLNYEKLQDDDYKLHDLIKDKYERKKYCDAKKTDPMKLIMQGKLPKTADDSFRDVEEDVCSSDEDRSAKIKRKDLGFIGIANKQQEPLFQINNSNNTNLISFDNNVNQNATSAKEKFSFISKNNQNPAIANTNNNTNFLMNTNQNNMINNNPSNNLFNINSSSSIGNGDLFDMKSGDRIVDEKMKKITDNIDELYKNPIINGSANYGLNGQNKPNKQNDLFNALNPQINNNMYSLNKTIPQQPQVNIQNNYYNYGNQQPGQYNLSHNNQFYANGMNLGFNNVNGMGNSGFNSGYGANYPGNANMNMNQQINFSKYNNNNNSGFSNGRVMNNANNFNNGFLTANDIYTKKDDLNLNYNGHFNGNNNLQATTNTLEFSEIKPKRNEDPFSNLISFK